MAAKFNGSIENCLLSDNELFEVENAFCDETFDLTDSPAWSTALKVGLNLLPAFACVM